MAHDQLHGETIFEVPALALNETVLRSFRKAFPQIADPTRNELKIYNGSLERVTLLLDNGERVFCRPDNFVAVEGRIVRWYQVSADGAINAGELEVYENNIEPDDEEDAI